METVELANFSAAYVSRLALALVRVLGAISVNPALGSARVPVRVRVALGLFVAVVLFPPGAPVARPVNVGPLEIAGELLLGLMAGFTVALIFAAVQFTGSLIGVSGGFGLAGAADPALDLGSSGVERFLSSFALLAFLQLNGHHLFLAGLRGLFETVDVGAATLPATAEQLIALSSGLFVAAVRMALPALAALLLTDLAFAVVARVAPQLNLFALGFSAKVGIGMVALLVGLPVTLRVLATLFNAAPGAMVAVAGR